MEKGANTTGDAPSWEVFKENTQPLKRGRDVNRLSKALTAKACAPSTAADLDSRIQELERTVTAEALDSSTDPLAAWLAYIIWVREEMPGASGQSKGMELMERCTRTYTHDPRFRNDERFIKVLR